MREMRNDHLKVLILPVSQVNGQANRTSSECIGRDKRVGYGSFLVGFHGLLVSNSRKVLNVIGEVHGVSEGGFQRVNDKVAVTIVRESNEKFNNLSSWQLNAASRSLSRLGEEQSCFRIRTHILQAFIKVFVNGGIFLGLFVFNNSLFLNFILSSY